MALVQNIEVNSTEVTYNESTVASTLDSLTASAERASVSGNRIPFEFAHRYSQSFNNNLRKQLQEYVENVYNFAPKVTVLPTGRAVAVYTVKLGSNSDPGQTTTPMRIDCMYSDDNGVNWTIVPCVDKGNLYATSETCIAANPADGYLYCFYTSFKGITGWGHAQQGVNPDNTSTIEYVVSKDKGLTWSAPVDITSQVKPAQAYFSSVAPTECGIIDGALAVPYYYLESINSNIVESFFKFNKDGTFTLGEVVRRESDADTPGRSGGEIGFGNFHDGTPFAIERAYDNTQEVYPYTVAVQKLLLRRPDKTWYVKGQFITTNCQAGFLRVGPEHGFAKDYLYVTAPIGATGTFDGRRNMRLFDCTDNFSSPVDLGMISDTNQLEASYSSTVLLSSGAMMSMWAGRQWCVSNSLFTANRLTGTTAVAVPFNGSFKILDISKTYSPDVRTGEVCINVNTGAYVKWNGSAFVSTRVGTDTTLNAAITSLNADTADLFYLNSGTAGSSISSITGGYLGQVISILPLSASTAVTLTAGSGSTSTRIMYRQTAGTATKYVTNGDLITLTKTAYGWYLDRAANTA